MTAKDPGVRFVPSRVDGAPDVTEVVVWPDRLEYVTQARTVVVRFEHIVRGARPRWRPVADRDWFHAPPDRFFRFYTSPPLCVCMPRDEPADGPTFTAIKVALDRGGYTSFDLG